MYYVPWIVTFLLLIMGAAVGVWAWYGDQVSGEAPAKAG